MCFCGAEVALEALRFCNRKEKKMKTKRAQEKKVAEFKQGQNRRKENN
jgi:hypothetical protein